MRVKVRFWFLKKTPPKFFSSCFGFESALKTIDAQMSFCSVFLKRTKKSYQPSKTPFWPFLAVINFFSSRALYFQSWSWLLSWSQFMIMFQRVPICRPFWPLSYGSEMMWDAGYSQFNVSLLGMDDFTPRTIRLRLEVRNSNSPFGRYAATAS